MQCQPMPGMRKQKLVSVLISSSAVAIATVEEDILSASALTAVGRAIAAAIARENVKDFVIESFIEASNN